MIQKMKFAVVAGVLALSLGAGFAFAAMSADDAIKARKACMKSGNGGVMGVAGPVMKGEKPFDAAALKAAFENVDKVCAGLGEAFAAGTETGTEKTGALPAIWSDPEGFKAAGGAWFAAATKLRAATDEASFKAAFPAFGGSCKGCHEKFRAPTQ